MERLQFLEMDHEQLYEKLVSFILDDLAEGQQLVDYLLSTERYRLDFQYRLVVDIGMNLCVSLLNKHQEVIRRTQSSIEQSIPLRKWDLISMNLNLMAISYDSLGMMDKALETFHLMIQSEEQSQNFHLTSTAYNNIGMIYHDMENHEKAIDYFRNSLKSLDKEQHDPKRRLSKYSYCLANLSINLLILDHLSEATSNFAELEKLNDHEIDIYSLIMVKEAFMWFHFYSNEFEKAHVTFLSSYELNMKVGDYESQIHLLRNYGFLCKKFNIPPQQYIPDLLKIEELNEESIQNYWLQYSIEIYQYILYYYQGIDDQENSRVFSQKYLRLLEFLNKQVKSNQQRNLSIIEDIRSARQENTLIEEKNKQLELIAEEAIQNKNQSDRMYQQIQRITAIGQKITSSLSLAEVIQQIYEQIKKKISITMFILMVADEKKNKLRTMFFYENDQSRPPYELSLSKPDSLSVSCYHRDELIVSNDVHNDTFLPIQKISFMGEKDIRSVLFLPISFQGEVMGVCSLQHRQKNAFSDQDLQFLEELKPFLAIALSNAIRSERLQLEIQSHKKTQQNLKKLNNRLQKISALDGLTKVSNRRSFDIHYTNLLRQAAGKNLPLTLMIMDIDDFKRYNDSYGHLAGDEALIKVAQTMEKFFDHNDAFFARFGGEEFVGVYMGLSPTESARLAEDIVRSIENLKIHHPSIASPYLTVSIGLATDFAPTQKSHENLMKMADDCLYLAKEKGKNRHESTLIE